MLSKVVEVDLKFKMRFFWLQALHNTHKQQRTDFFFFLTDSKITSMHMSSSNVNICMKECVTEMKLIVCVCVCVIFIADSRLSRVVRIFYIGIQTDFIP
jgi:hypothetical protein